MPPPFAVQNIAFNPDLRLSRQASRFMTSWGSIFRSSRVGMALATSPATIISIKWDCSKSGRDRPGYRVYYAQRGTALILLCCGGDKSTQDGGSSTQSRLQRPGESEEYNS